MVMRIRITQLKLLISCGTLVQILSLIGIFVAFSLLNLLIYLDWMAPFVHQGDTTQISGNLQSNLILGKVKKSIHPSCEHLHLVLGDREAHIRSWTFVSVDILQRKSNDNVMSLPWPGLWQT